MSSRVLLGPVSFLPERHFVVVALGRRIQLEEGTFARSALVGRINGEVRAYANLCRHLAIPLDMNDGWVMDSDGTELECHHHGARFALDTGECTFGPCFGKSLFAMTVVVDEQGTAYLEVP